MPDFAPWLASRGGACAQRPVLDSAWAPRLCGSIGTMIRLSTFTPRMWLILAHDLLATAAAVVASFFIRFEEAGLGERWALLAIWLPALRSLFRLRLRLSGPLQVQVALHLAARPLQHRARRNGAGGHAAGARLRAAGAQCLRHVLLRQDHDRPLLAAADRIPVGPAHRLPLFPLHAHAPARQGGSLRRPPSSSAAPPTPTCCCAPSKAAP